ncbi:MAG: hypothetical protein ABIB98_02805 [bacterium]
MKEIPKKLQPILWSSSVDTLSPEKDAIPIIHKVLAYGDMVGIKWLVNFYGKRRVIKIFLKDPMNLYTKQSFNFIKNFILGLEKVDLEEVKYVKTLY